MTINRLGGLNPLNNVTSTQKATAKSSIAPQTDTISISDEAKEMAEVYFMSEVAKETPDVRTDLIEQIKEKIKDPNYLNAAVIESTANDNLVASISNIILGKASIDSYDAAIKAAKDAGYDKLIKINQAAYERYISRNK
jgi:negative regulator of flagellin synthesis FlgM